MCVACQFFKIHKSHFTWLRSANILPLFPSQVPNLMFIIHQLLLPYLKNLNPKLTFWIYLVYYSSLLCLICFIWTIPWYSGWKEPKFKANVFIYVNQRNIQRVVFWINNLAVTKYFFVLIVLNTVIILLLLQDFIWKKKTPIL